MSSGPQYLRAGAIARLLGVSERTVRRWITDKTLPSSRLGGARLVSRAALERFLGGPPEPGPDEDCGDE
jgi:excisionase family DNA binding protein